jgi:hypothetical protein
MEPILLSSRDDVDKCPLDLEEGPLRPAVGVAATAAQKSSDEVLDYSPY